MPADLKPGDSVRWQGACYWHGSRTAKVARITKTMVVLQNGKRFNRTTGLECGRGTERFVSRIHPINKET